MEAELLLPFELFKLKGAGYLVVENCFGYFSDVIIGMWNQETW